MGGGEEAFFVLAGYVVVVLADGGYHYLGMMGGLGLLLVAEDFLVKLLSFAETGELYFYAFCPRELYHALGKVDNLDGSSHVEDKDFTSFAHSAGFEDELACLGDEHEEADDVGMGDGDGASLEKLLLEDGDDTAVAAQNIAEAGGDELGDAFNLALDNSLVQGLAIDFADALGASHDIGGVDSLVGGDHDEFLGFVLHGKVCYHARTIYIILYCYAGVVLHHGNVLVGGSMEDVVGTELGEDLLHVVLVGNAADNGVTRYVGELTCHHKADVVHGGLCLVDEYHGRGTVEGNLAHHLGTYGAGGAGDEDDLAVEQLANGVHVDLNLVTWQEVFNVNLLKLDMREFAVAVPLFGCWHHHDAYSCGKELVDHLVVLAEEGALEGGDKEGLDAKVLHTCGDAFMVEVNLSAKEGGILHLLPIRDEGLQTVFLFLDGGEALGKGDASCLGAVDGYRDSIVGMEIVIHPLYDNTFHPHEHGGNKEGGYNALR